MKSLSTSSTLSTEIKETSCILGPRWACFLYLLINKCISILVHTKIAFIGKHHFEILGLKRFARDMKVCPPNKIYNFKVGLQSGRDNLLLRPQEALRVPQG